MDENSKELDHSRNAPIELRTFVREDVLCKLTIRGRRYGYCQPHKNDSMGPRKTIAPTGILRYLMNSEDSDLSRDVCDKGAPAVGGGDP